MSRSDRLCISPRRIGRSYTKVLSQQIAFVKDELAGSGLFKGKKAKGDRQQELEQQLKAWEALQKKLNETPSE